MIHRPERYDLALSTPPESAPDIKSKIKQIEDERARLLGEIGGMLPKDLHLHLNEVYRPRSQFTRGSKPQIVADRLRDYLGKEKADAILQILPEISEPDRRRFEPHEPFPPFEVPEGDFPETETESDYAERTRIAKERQHRDMVGVKDRVFSTALIGARWIHPAKEAEANVARANEVLTKLRIHKPDGTPVFHIGMTFDEVAQERSYVEQTFQERWREQIKKISEIDKEILRLRAVEAEAKKKAIQHPLGTIGDLFGDLFKK